MERVRVLLDTHDEPYERELSRPERSLTGFTEPRRRLALCGHCGGATCERCEAGRRVAAAEKRRIPAGRVELYERDDYDNGDKGFWAGPEAKTMDARQVDRALAALREDELKRHGVIADIDFEETLLQAERRDRRGSYETLRAALDFLPSSLRGEDAIRWLAVNMPGPIRVPRWAFEMELDGIDQAVVDLKDEGLGREEIAAKLGISQRQVKTALRRARPS